MSLFFKFIFLFIFIHSLQSFSQQKELQVNGIPLSNISCAEIKISKVIPEVLSGYICDIRDAHIVDDCLELTIVYGGCSGNLELITDSISTRDSKLNFKARWIEPSMCKALMLAKISFDLKPYKNLIKENMCSLKIMGTEFELMSNY